MDPKIYDLVTYIMNTSGDSELRRLASEVIKKHPTGPDFSEQYFEENQMRKLWDLQRKI